MSDRYRVTSLDSIEALPGPGSLRWLPVRHELGIGAFGTNAYVAQAAGDDVVEPHTESSSGHEELYFVARGSATFTLDGDEVRAPAGTYVFLPDPAVHRRAVADEAGTPSRPARIRICPACATARRPPERAPRLTLSGRA